MRRIALFLLLLFGFELPAQTGGLTLPAPVGYVNDFAGVISADARARTADSSACA